MAEALAFLPAFFAIRSSFSTSLKISSAMVPGSDGDSVEIDDHVRSDWYGGSFLEG